MHFELSEEHLMIQKAAREFAQNELKPGVIERDEHQKFPTEQVKKMAELGFLGMMVDPKYGGSGMDAGTGRILQEHRWRDQLRETHLLAVSAGGQAAA